jgi:1A family penicillin-binding protein
MNSRPQPLIYAAVGVLIVLGVLTGLVVHRLWMFRDGVEKLADRLTLNVGPESTLLYDTNNNLVSALFEEHRIGVRLEAISPHLVNAVVAVEDKRFWNHGGIDPRRIVMAGVANHRAGQIVQGGSTITQQLVRSILLNRQKSYTRKFKEAILARRLEERYDKRDILAAYLNRVYFGDGYYGIEAAAIGYFGKPASALDIGEAATLAGLIKGPSVYSPTQAPERSRKRRDLVLNVMRAEGLLSEKEYQDAIAVPVNTLVARGDTAGVADPRHTRGAEYFRDAVTRDLVKRFGAEAVYTGGLRVYTTLDRRLQAIAEDVVSARLMRMPHRRNAGEPLQGALVAIEPRTGFVKALVGGRDFTESSFNRAIDARRQPGSAFKPLIFALALESGLSPSTTLEGLDEPIPTREGPWLPDGEHELTSIRLRDALVVSSNRAAAHLLQQVGLHRALDFVSRFGVTSPMPEVPSLALGTGEVSLYELSAAYAVFANRGVWRAPTMIRRVVDRYGHEIYRAPDTERPVISEATAYLMTSMMADVVNRGTATTARTAGFRLKAAGKTGTSSDFADAWFVGYTPQLVTGVWIGYDKPQMIMDRGFASVVAVPTWARFMTAATRDVSDDWFQMPGSLTTVKLCRVSGLLATDRCHLPVVEPPPFDPNDSDVLRTAVLPIVREGGVYEELRHVGRMPEPCPLHHGDVHLSDLQFDEPESPSYRPPPAENPAYRPPSAPVPPFMRPPAGTSPPSLTPPDTRPVRPDVPDPTPQTPVIPGSNMTTSPVPPRPPGR